MFGTTGIAKIAVGLVAAAVVAVGALGVAAAQTPRTPAAKQQSAPAGYENFIAALAAKLGKSPQELKDAVVTTEKDLIEKRVAEGRLTRAQADALIKKVEQTGGAAGFAVPAAKAAHKAAKERRDKARRAGDAGRPLRILAVAQTRAAAQFLGVTERELAAELRQGKSLAEIAVARGKTRDELKAAIVAGLTQRVNDAVTAGKLTREQGDRLTQGVTQRLDAIVDAKRKAPAPRTTGSRA